MPKAHPTPGLRLTPERRAEIRHAIKHNPEVDAQDALDLLHDLDVLEHEVERLREALEAILGEIADEAAGHETEWPAWVRRVWQIAVRAASGQRGEVA